ncbi:MAG: hypothetical protein Q7T05_03305 [Dehalococcoidia bacterium]|nr:hypothetical protein [Dehalococcoidia bacterium]
MYNGTAVWANNAGQNTEVTNDITLPTIRTPEDVYQVVVTNPSAVSAITVKVCVKLTPVSNARYPELTLFGVPVSKTNGYARNIQGLAAGEAIRLILSNDTALGAADGFTAEIGIRKVGRT